MKKFKFRLEGLYKFRLELERQAQLEVQQLRLEESLILKNLHKIRDQQEEWGKAYNLATQNPEDQKWIFLVEQYLIALDREKINQEVKLANLRITLEEAIRKVEKAYQSRRQVELLREREREEFYKNMERVEQREMSELNAIRFLHQQKEEEGRI